MGGLSAAATVKIGSSSGFNFSKLGTKFENRRFWSSGEHCGEQFGTSFVEFGPVDLQLMDVLYMQVSDSP